MFYLCSDDSRMFEEVGSFGLKQNLYQKRCELKYHEEKYKKGKTLASSIINIVFKADY